MPSPGLAAVSLPAAHFVAEACRRIVAESGCGPDLSHVTVLLPQPYAAPELARALQREAGGPLLLPRLTTLRQWAAEVPLDRAVTSPAAREAAIYHALAGRRWFPEQDLWPLASELAALFDELTRWHVGMPASAEDFSCRLEQAYQARAGASFDFEARLVHELWHALGTADGLDPEAAHQLRLDALARRVAGPIYVVGAAETPPAEREFLQRCAERVPVTVLAEDHTQPADDFERVLQAAWRESSERSLHERARSVAAAIAQSPLSSRVRWFGAIEAEQEAYAVAASVCEWLRAGRTSIAVVALDRVVARRARALLERMQILVRDEAGWPLSTTSAATAIGRWFDVAGNDFYHRDLLDLLKSPFAFADWRQSERFRTVSRLEQTLRRNNLRAGLDAYLRVTGEDGEPMRQLLLRVQRAAAALAPRRRKTLPGWIDALASSLDALGVRRGFEDDAAGIELLALLEGLRGELASERTALDFGEFRRWIAARLESAAFRDAGIESPVVFTSLEATRLRSFEAVLVTGADASRLPGNPAAATLFNQRVRRDLGLPGVAEHVRDQRSLLLGLLARSREALVTWQRRMAGEPNLPSPFFERLRTLHDLAWGGSLEDTALPAVIERLRLRDSGAPAAIAPAGAPAPRVGSHLLPASMSASGYNTLLACPYRYYARYLLRLQQTEEVQEELEKSDYGTRVHDILTRFHAAHPSLLELAPEQAEQALHAFSEAEFAADIAESYVSNAWLARWRARIPRYVAWQRERETRGWRFHGGELERQVTITTPGGRQVLLKGRIDRVDRRDDGAVAVIDYKTRPRYRLQEDLRSPGEDVQLPMYVLLWSAPVAEALYLPLDTDELEPVELQGDLAAYAAEVRDRLAVLLDSMGEGAPLPAQGIEAVCTYCEVGGLCRRNHWT